jgi:hypothetical protein
MTKKQKRLIVIVIALIALAKWGLNPFAPHMDTADVLAGADQYTALETGVHRQGNGVYVVKALTRMPNVKAKMVKWWFADYMETTEHYKMWHPAAHVWMDWENKIPGEVIGASHLVDEYIGTKMEKLRIQFIDPSEFLTDYEQLDGRFVICARVGFREEPINVTSMCHIVRDTPFGAEMRSHFWLGHVAKREGNDEVFSIEGIFGNTALVRFILLDQTFAVDLMTHAIQEMGNLSDFLPGLYNKAYPNIKGE